MGLRLTVDRSKWHERVRMVATGFPGVIPVVKGNGYGFGRAALFPVAAEISDTIAVGTVYEAAGAPDDRRLIVLTPHVGALPEEMPRRTALTVGSIEHVDALRAQRWRGAVIVKLESSMHRYGVSAGRLEELTDAVIDAGLDIVEYSLHLPLAGSDEQRSREIEVWLARLDDRVPLSVSHLDETTYAQLRATNPDRVLRIRLGTHLWHGDKRLLHLTADVVDVRRLSAGDVVGYRAAPVPTDGAAVLIAAGSAHGVHPLD